MAIRERIRRGWNAFLNKDKIENRDYDYGMASYSRPDRTRLRYTSARTIMAPVINRIGIDCASIKIEHCRLDKEGRYTEPINDSLNYCLQERANIDQTGRAFIQDIVESLLDEGEIAIVPVDCDTDLISESSFGILTMRRAKIEEWYPEKVKLRMYNDITGREDTLVLPKEKVAIITNPLYTIMNSPNSTMQRLLTKLALLDTVDKSNSSGKLDIIIQLPYVIKGEERRRQAEARRKDIERQLTNGKYGIAYTDGTEHITQLNRPAENTLMNQVEYLQNLFYSQLGMTQAIFDGTADEQTMTNYYTRTIEPIVSAVTDAMRTIFLTKTARTQGQSIEFFRDPFRLVPVSQLPDIADKFTRNEILTSNEIRNIIGYKPSDDPGADELRNKNLNQSKYTESEAPVSETPESQDSLEEGGVNDE